MSATASRWGTREKKDHTPSPEEFEEEVARLVALIRREGKLTISGGFIRIPIDTSRLSISVKDGIQCPKCRTLKLTLRPHQPDQRFCFGCGYIEPV